MSQSLMDQITFNADGLITAVAQCADTKQVLMLAWMNAEALAITLETKQVTYFSRSRQALWRKGETSGHTQELIGASLDCDGDAVLLLIKQTGPACHTGAQSCFFKDLT